MFQVPALVAVGILSAAVQASVTGKEGSNPPPALMEYASEWQKKFQPYIDFDKVRLDTAHLLVLEPASTIILC